MIRLLSTLHGARRVWEGPILRLLDGGQSQFVVGMTGSGIVSAIASDGPTVDGSIDVLDLMAGGTLPAHNASPADPPVELGDDLRQGVTPAGHAVLDRADKQRAPHVDSVDLLRGAAEYATLARSGDLLSRRHAATMAGAFSVLAIEAIDEELAA